MKRIVKVRRPIWEAPINRALAENQMLQYNNIDHANGSPMTPPSTQPVITGGANNPNFRAQFNIKILKQYYTETGGAYTAILPAALDPTLQVPLPYFVFGYNDSNSGYRGLINNLPVSSANWTVGAPFIFGKDASTIAIAIDDTVTSGLERGDLIIPFTSTQPGGGTTTLALVIVRSSTVGYGTLLNSLVSDTFAINLIRYIVADETTSNIAQFTNDITLFGISLFGKITTDRYSPNASKTPEQEQRNIIDIDISKNMDKEGALAGYINFDVDTFDWSIFVSYFNKFKGV